MHQYGLCQCGCGEKAPISTETKQSRGLTKGEPTRFLPGHHRRKAAAPLCGYLIDAVSGCWNWQLKMDKRGYGQTRFNERYRSAHIVEWIKVNGPIPGGFELDHLCRNTSCVNPRHLELVTPTENKRRSRATKLTVKNVEEIKASTLSNKDLAAKFNVDPSNISHIRRGFSWVDVGI